MSPSTNLSTTSPTTVVATASNLAANKGIDYEQCFTQPGSSRCAELAFKTTDGNGDATASFPVNDTLSGQIAACTNATSPATSCFVTVVYDNGSPPGDIASQDIYFGSGPNLNPPDAAVTVTPSSGAAPLAVTADASASTSTGSAISAYAFNFGDGTVVGPSSSATATHTYTTAGTWTVTVTVSAQDGSSSQATTTVVSSQPPHAALSLSSQNGSAPFALTADGSSSTGGSTPIATYAVDFGDGSSSTTSTAPVGLQHTYSDPGTYVVRLTVIDSDGDSASTTSTVTVSPAVSTVASPYILYTQQAQNSNSFGSTNAIWGVSPDGTDPHAVLAADPSTYGYTMPDLSPDGTELVVSSQLSGLAIGPSNGSAPPTLVVAEDNAAEPRFSPNGSSVAYTVLSSGIWVANADGSDAHEIVSDATAGEPAWSPDGTEIAYDSYANNVGTIDVYNVATGQQSSAVPAMANAVEPIWSPNGQQITFMKFAPSGNFQVWVMNSDGSGARQIGATVSEGAGDEAAWSPDSSEIAVANSDGLDIINVASGTVVKSIAAAPGTEDLSPAWATAATGSSLPTVDWYPGGSSNSSAGPTSSTDVYANQPGQDLTVPATGGLLSNDTQPAGPGGQLGVRLISGPDDGSTLTLNGDGSFQLDPPAGGLPPWSVTNFTYVDDNGVYTSPPTTVSVVTLAKAGPPVAENDSYQMPAGLGLTISANGYLANDTDDGSFQPPSAKIIKVTLPSDIPKADVVVGTNGSISVKRGVGKAGDVIQFTYQAVSFGGQKSNIATATITVSAPPADPPIGTSDEYQVKAGDVLKVSAPGVLGNDISPKGLALTAAFGAITAGTHGLDVYPNGSFTISTTAADAGAVEGFTYQPVDSKGTHGQSTSVTIDVLADQAPVATDVTYTAEGRNPAAPTKTVTTCFTVGPLSYDYDPDGPAPTNFTITNIDFAADEYTWVNNKLCYVAQNVFKTSTSPPKHITYYVTDAEGMSSNLATVTINIVPWKKAPPPPPPPNKPPTVIAHSYTIPAGSILRVTAADGVLKGSSDSNGVKIVSDLSASLVTQDPPAGSMTLASTGAFRFNAPDSLSGKTFHFTYKATDSGGLSATAVVTITVTVPKPVCPPAETMKAEFSGFSIPVGDFSQTLQTCSIAGELSTATTPKGSTVVQSVNWQTASGDGLVAANIWDTLGFDIEPSDQAPDPTAYASIDGSTLAELDVTPEYSFTVNPLKTVAGLISLAFGDGILAKIGEYVGLIGGSLVDDAISLISHYLIDPIAKEVLEWIDSSGLPDLEGQVVPLFSKYLQPVTDVVDQLTGDVLQTVTQRYTSGVPSGQLFDNFPLLNANVPSVIWYVDQNGVDTGGFDSGQNDLWNVTDTS